MTSVLVGHQVPWENETTGLCLLRSSRKREKGQAAETLTPLAKPEVLLVGKVYYPSYPMTVAQLQPVLACRRWCQRAAH